MIKKIINFLGFFLLMAIFGAVVGGILGALGFGGQSVGKGWTGALRCGGSGAILLAIAGGYLYIKDDLDKRKKEKAATEGVREPVPEAQVVQPAMQKTPLPEKAKYTDIGPVMGTCSICKREVYAVPGRMMVNLVTSGQSDKIEANAVWCTNCDTLYCMGCASKTNARCPACHAEVVDYANRRK